MRTAAALILILLVGIAPVAAQGEPRLSDLDGQEFNARGLHILVYHPYPDPQGDPWGYPERESNGSRVGYMEGAYGAYWYPTTVFDGFERVEGAPSFLETYDAYSQIYFDRREEESPLRLFVNGALGEDAASITVRAQAKRDTPSPQIHLRLVLFEDEVPFDGGNGVDVHRFVARATLHDGPIVFNTTGAAEAPAQVALDPSWNRERLGVVASLHNRDTASATYRPGESLQATTYRFDQAGPTIQDRRGVLLETLSGTWCDACVYGDGAVDELANQYGVASSKALAAGNVYLRPFMPRLPAVTTGTWETGLLVFAFLAFALAFGADFARLPMARRERAVRRALGLGVVALTLALAILLLYFLVANLSIEYVFAYTRADYPWYYRLAGLWAGQKGTLLIWAAATGLFALAFLRLGERAAARGALPDDAAATLRASRRALLLILLGLTWATLVARTFAPTPETMLRFRPDGNGLQPVLLTPFMIIHPPIQFLSYAMTGLLFAAGLAHVATGGRAWAALARPWARLNWLLATIGLGLGGLWAYYVLNFGGFWAWDPVETANLLAWFPLTLLLHSLIRYGRGEHGTIAPLFALLTLPMVLFSTVATRTGLWVSVHAFTDPTENFARDPLVRLLNILATSELLRLLVALLLASLLASFAAVALGRARNLEPRRRSRARLATALLTGLLVLLLLADPVAALGLSFQAAQAVTLGRSAAIGLLLLSFAAVAAVILTGREPETANERHERGWRRWMEPGPLLTAGILLLSLAFLATFLLDVGGVNGYDRRVFDDRAPFVALPILLVLAAHFLRGLYGLRVAIAGPFAALALGALLALSFADHVAVLLVLPALGLAAAASLLKFLDVAGSGPHADRRDRSASLLLVVGALLAFVHWGNPPSRLFGLDVAWGWALPAYALAALALFAGALHRGRPHAALARAGALALVPLVGPFYLSTLAGVAALALLWNRPTTHRLREAVRERRGSLRKATVYLLHVGLALGLTGYAFATYESLATEPYTIGDGSPAIRGYTFEPVGASFEGRDATQDLPKEVHARIRVLHDGGFVQDATLTYWLVPDGTPGHYDARVTVLRRATEDVYLFPTAVHLGDQTLTDHINGASPRDATLQGVELTTKVLPGVGLVWSGLWILGLAMTARLLLGGFEIGTPAPAARTAASPVRPPHASSEPVASTAADFGGR